MRWTVLGCVLAAGCSLGPQIQRNVADYHAVFGNSGDTVVLDNIIRSANGLPLHFSILSKINGTITASASVSLSVPFGQVFPPSAVRDSVSPAFSVASNPTFEVDNLETQNFTQGILQPIDPVQFKNFLDTGLDYRVALLLFVSGVRITGHDPDRPGPLILNAPSSNRFVCYADAQLDAEGRLPREQVFLNYTITPRADDCAGAEIGGRRYFKSEPEMFAFVRIVNAIKPFFANEYTEASAIGPPFPADKLVAGGFDKLVALDPAKTALTSDDGGKTFHVERLSPKIVLCETEPEADRSLQLLRPIGDPLCRPAAQPVRAGSTIRPPGRLDVLSGANLRSVAAMFDYVGQVVAWQRRQHRCLTVDLPTGGRDATCAGNVFFRLREAGEPAAFRVNYDGATYGVGGSGRCGPGAGPGSPTEPCDYSSQVLNVLALALGLNIQPKDLPQTPVIQLLP